MNACFSGGGFFGAIFVGWACDYLGRKKTLLVATPIAIVGGALQGGAVNIAMFLVGRLLGGFAVGLFTTLATFEHNLIWRRYPGGLGSTVSIRGCTTRYERIPRISARSGALLKSRSIVQFADS